MGRELESALLEQGQKVRGELERQMEELRASLAEAQESERGARADASRVLEKAVAAFEERLFHSGKEQETLLKVFRVRSSSGSSGL